MAISMPAAPALQFLKRAIEDDHLGRSRQTALLGLWQCRKFAARADYRMTFKDMQTMCEVAAGVLGATPHLRYYDQKPRSVIAGLHVYDPADKSFRHRNHPEKCKRGNVRKTLPLSVWEEAACERLWFGR